MGLDRHKVYAWAKALCLRVVAIAEVFLVSRSNFDPFMGPVRLIFGFEAVIIGGLGNLSGAPLPEASSLAWPKALAPASTPAGKCLRAIWPSF
ncbi:MAG: hypothetical protein ACOH2H_12230 [Cypionkella sp.]